MLVCQYYVQLLIHNIKEIDFTMENKTFLLIDGFNLLSRGYFATSYGKEPEQLTKNSEGVYTNGLRVFFLKLFNLITEHGVSHLAVAWDIKREETARRQQYSFYKASRSELPQPLIEQFEVCKKVLDSIGIKQVSVAPYEADDVIGTLANNWSSNNYGHCYIYSNDKDLFQLLNENTSLIIGGKKGDNIYSLKHFQEEYGITSKQWIDVKALLGDASDNIPGCPGVGEKSALPLVQLYGSIENIFEQVEVLDKKFNRYKKKLIEGKDITIISKKLSEIICDIAELNEILFDELLLNISRENLVLELNELNIRVRY